MREEGGFNSGSVLLSFLLGGMVGAGLALLLAPQAGTETRRRIREFADDVKGKASDYVDNTKESMSSIIEKGKHVYEDRKSAIAAAFEAGKEAYEKEAHK
jgi:gas vesicle protein